MTEYIAKQEALLRNQIIPQTMKPDFAQFWQESIDWLRTFPISVKREKVDTPYERSFITYLLSWNTHDDTWIDAYFTVPADAAGKLPCVVYYHGGSGKKHIPTDIPATGICALVMDVRGQGGTSPDWARYTSGDVNGRVMNRGVTDKNNFYMRNIYLDAVRAVDVAATLPEVDPERIVTFGGSQGGALSIVASALSGLSKKCYTAVTSYCCLHQRLELGSGILGGAKDFLTDYPQYTDAVMDTLTYFDINNMVSLLKVPTRFCLGLSDTVCLPKFVYSAYTHTECEKQMDIYPFCPHRIPKEWTYLTHEEFTKL